MRLLTLAALVTAALTFTPGTASAANPCGGGGNGRQGGPVRNLIGAVRENMQERRAARGCQPAQLAFPAATPVAGVAVPVSACSGGVCQTPR